MSLERKLKTAMDESRLLILGVQVLFGFQFEAAFQELFARLAPAVQAVHCAGLLLLLLGICGLIAPSMLHQIAFAGETHPSAVRSATAWTGISLLPFSLGLGASAFVVFQATFGDAAGIGIAVTLAAIALMLLYGVGLMLKRDIEERAMDHEPTVTPLSTKIEQMLTEARVIIPGGQALLGFQFIAMLTAPFHKLPTSIQLFHTIGLGAVALSVLLLMTPAAVHRIAFAGENDPQFFKIGSRLVITASLPLALGIAADVGVVFFVVTDSAAACVAGAISAFCLATGIWLVFPAVWRRLHSGRGK